MDKKITFKTIIGNILLSLGELINVYVIFPFGLVYCFWAFEKNSPSFIVSILCVSLLNFILGLIPFIPGFIILFSNRKKDKIFKFNILTAFLIHLMISFAFTFKFTIG